MPTGKRYELTRSLPRLSFRPGAALREALRQGYGPKDLVSDALAGLVVGVVALPLAMALAIATGVPPQHGLYTAIVAGAVIAILGGSRVAVSGPTAAFIVILQPIVLRHGVGGLLLATVLAGAILVGLGLARLGRLIEYIPHPVTTGFTSGIAVVIATSQLDELLGLELPKGVGHHYTDVVAALATSLRTVRPADVVVAVLTLAVLIGWPRLTKRVPGALVALSLAAAVGAVLAQVFPDHAPLTLGTRFSYELNGVLRPGIPPLPPLPVLPWSFGGPGGAPLVVTLEVMRSLVPAAIAIALLGGIESLLCAVVADGMAGTKHDPDAELVAQGIGNLIAPFFGGFAATGAIARTATSVRAGARSPIAAVVHAAFVLVVVVAAAPLLGYLPMAALAALLLVVAWNMSEAKHFLHMLRVAPRSDVVVLVICFALTVLFDMVVAVSFGVMLAALLFMRRMAELSRAQLHGEPPERLKGQIPPGVVLYEIAGPLFFGAAQKAMGALSIVEGHARVVVLDLSAVPTLDATGLVALESAIARVEKAKAKVLLAGVQGHAEQVLSRAGLTTPGNRVKAFPTLAEALAYARELTATGPSPLGAPS